MKYRPPSAEEQGRHLAEQWAAGIADTVRTQEARTASGPGCVTWTHAQLRERIQQAGAALAAAAELAHTPTHKPDRSPQADREPEP